jgi:oligopeptide/dipeptide ABC transporter ATP-binding protein
LSETKPLVSVRGLTKHFAVRKGVLDLSRTTRYVHAVDGVSFDIGTGDTLSLAGQSGCGKTTIARLMMRVISPSSGSITFEGNDIFALDRERLRITHQKMQMIFQDPYGSLNPRMKVFDAVAEPLDVNKFVSETSERTARVHEALKTVELEPPERFSQKYPHELSGGERQRVAIARGLVLKPKFIAADEPVSMLDVSVRAGILNLLLDLRSRAGISMLFITHDLAVAKYVSDRIAIMYLGRIVEIGTARDVIEEPLHPYTQALISVVPSIRSPPKPEVGSVGEPPDAINIPKGCRFHPRCPHAQDICKTDDPQLRRMISRHYVACHIS